MEINKALCRTLHAEIEEALKAVADKHGMKIKIEGMTYGHTEIRFRATAVSLDIPTGGMTDPKAAAVYNLNCGLYKMKPEWLEQVFSYKLGNGQPRSIRIIGFDIKKVKYPVLVMQDETKLLYYTVDMIRDIIENKCNTLTKTEAPERTNSITTLMEHLGAK